MVDRGNFLVWMLVISIFFSFETLMADDQRVVYRLQKSLTVDQRVIHRFMKPDKIVGKEIDHKKHEEEELQELKTVAQRSTSRRASHGSYTPPPVIA
ncbi:hypothetical protein LINPERHAP2_LOCUS41509 [Linum perenne]